LSDGGGTRGSTVLVFDDASGSPDTRRVFTFTHDLAIGLAGSRILLATPGLTSLAGFAPDFVLRPGMLAPRNGRVCYFVNPPQNSGQPTGVIDCVAYGKFTGENGPFGPPRPSRPTIARSGASRSPAATWTTGRGPSGPIRRATPATTRRSPRCAATAPSRRGSSATATRSPAPPAPRSASPPACPSAGRATSMPAAARSAATA